MRFGYRLGFTYTRAWCAWAFSLALLSLAGCQASSGSFASWYLSQSADVVATPSIAGMVQAVVGGSQTLTVSFSTSESQRITDLAITSGLSLPSGWSGPSSFTCSQLGRDALCDLTLTYTPTANSGGMLMLTYSYIDQAGHTHPGMVSIPYISSSNNNIVATASPAGQVNAVVGAGSQSVEVTFTTDDGNPATGFSVTSNLGSLPSGWTSSSGSFSCASASTGNGCGLALSYAPSAVSSGTLTLSYNYTDNAGQEKSGALNIPYASASSDSVVGTPSPSGQIAVSLGGSEAVSVVFDTNDGNAATNLSVTSDLTSLPSGWSSSAGSFSCGTVSTGNGCQLSLTYAPTAVGSGTLSLQFSYTNNARTAKSGSVMIPYAATTHDNVVGTASPTGQIAVTVNGGQGVSVTFDTDDGNVATSFSITTDLASLPSGWTSGTGSLSCASVSTDNACQLALTYAPTAVASGTLILGYSYLDDSGAAKSGSVSIPYTATTNNHVTGTAAPSGKINVAVNASQAVSVTFTTSDGNIATALSVTSNLSPLPSGWSSGSGNFGCASVSTGNACQLSLTYAPTVAVNATLTLNYSYTNNAGTSESGSVSIPYTSNATVGGTVTGLNGTVSLQDNGGDTLVLSSNGSFSFATALASGAAYNVTVSSQPTGQICTVSNGSGTVTTDVTSIVVTCTTNTYSVGGSVAGLSQSGLMLTDNGGDALSVPAGSSTFTFATQIAYGANYAVAVSTQPTGQTCTVFSGSGTVTGTVTSVSVSCSTNTYNLGGTINGLSQSGLVLADNSGNPLPVGSGSTSFTFSTQLSYGATYAVAVSTQPTGQICTVSNGSGTVTGTVTSVTLSCVSSYTIGGTISLLNVSSVVLANGSATVTVSAGASSWVFATSFATGSGYSVTVQTQPAGESCQVTSGGSGTLSSNVNNVTVVCAFGQWTWIDGSNATGASGNYGTEGTASSSNVPRGEAYGMSWTDHAGNLWFFGGYQGNWLNNLWMYNPSTSEWTWVGGSNSTNAYGVYGTKGTASAGNIPGARSSGTSWVDSTGNLWMFGGYGYPASPGGGGPLNDLWEYSTSSAEWTWVAGSSSAGPSGVYGTKGTPSASNIPGGRSGQISWIDTSGNVWIFGGKNNGGYFNDLWEYIPSAGTWTWISGSNSTGASGVYGTQGVASSSNVPPAEGYGAPWLDSSGNLWFFAGYNGSNYLNALWMYSPSTNEWTWEGGSSGTNANGVYGTKGVAAAGNVPGARESPLNWTDSSGNFWMFGGAGYGVSGGAGYLYDLWEYSPTGGQWTWVGGGGGLNVNGVYGTEGTASASNYPGSRWGGAFNWIDLSGNLWILGADGYGTSGGLGYLNDLWKFTPAAQ